MRIKGGDGIYGAFLNFLERPKANNEHEEVWFGAVEWRDEFWRKTILDRIAHITEVLRGLEQNTEYAKGMRNAISEMDRLLKYTEK